MLLSVLATVEFYTPFNIPRAMPESSFVVKTQANGLCLWSCLFLAAGATRREKYFWIIRQRNSSGFGDPGNDQKEAKTVQTWALSLNDGNVPEGCRLRILKGESAVHEDIAS